MTPRTRASTSAIGPGQLGRAGGGHHALRRPQKQRVVQQRRSRPSPWLTADGVRLSLLRGPADVALLQHRLEQHSRLRSARDKVNLVQHIAESYRWIHRSASRIKKVGTWAFVGGAVAVMIEAEVAPAVGQGYNDVWGTVGDSYRQAPDAPSCMLGVRWTPAGGSSSSGSPRRSTTRYFATHVAPASADGVPRETFLPAPARPGEAVTARVVAGEGGAAAR